jgi:hypothetical protein
MHEIMINIKLINAPNELHINQVCTVALDIRAILDLNNRICRNCFADTFMIFSLHYNCEKLIN